MFERQRFPVRLIIDAVVAVVGFVDYHVDLPVVLRVDGAFGVHTVLDVLHRIHGVFAPSRGMYYPFGCWDTTVCIGVLLVCAVDTGQSVHVFQALTEGRGLRHSHRGRGDEREEEHENGNNRNQYPTLVHSESADNKSNDTNDNESTDNKIARTRLVGNLPPSGEIRCHF